MLTSKPYFTVRRKTVSCKYFMSRNARVGRPKFTYNIRIMYDKQGRILFYNGKNKRLKMKTLKFLLFLRKCRVRTNTSVHYVSFYFRTAF